ncbi:MAG: M20/M25/M40 family metallo-hydrolase [Lachnospiraceae bacterium]|nr:M20/M25/M40 family metallo-hydrolase [Lachnospiraceae bacterium]
METVKVLNRLIKAQGVTGFERSGITQTAAELFREFTEGFEDAKVWTDVNGNAYASVGSSGPTVMIMAHMDEIGMAVTKIEDNGMLRIDSVAGVDPRVLPGSRLRVCGRKELTGVVGAVPPHLSDDTKKAYKWADLTVDLGLKKERVQEFVAIGDRVTFYPEDVLELKNGFVSSKTLDDRALVAAELYCLELLKKRKFECKVVVVASVDEEHSGLGATTGAYSVKPDMAIVMDVTHGKSSCASDCFDMDKVALAIGSNIHPRMFEMLRDAADEAKIGWEYEPCMGPTGTDTTDVQVSRLGVPCGLVSPPLRYMHTNVETIQTETLLNCGRICAEFITALGGDWRDKLCLD